MLAEILGLLDSDVESDAQWFDGEEPVIFTKGAVDLNPTNIEERVLKQLKQAGIDAHLMLQCLRKGNGIISGSTPLPILLDLKFKPNDLDVYVLEEDEDRMLDLVKDSFLFTIVRQSDNPYRDVPGLLRTHWLKKGTQVINVMVVAGDNAASAIFQFHSTIVMNYISGWGVFCAYPELTLEGKSITNLSVLTNEEQRKRATYCFDKYGERGIDHRKKLSDHRAWSSHVCGVDPSCPTTFRALHDRTSLFIPFASVELKDGPSPIYDGKTSMVWSLGGSPCKEGPAVYHPTFTLSVKALAKFDQQISKANNAAEEADFWGAGYDEPMMFKKSTHAL